MCTLILGLGVLGPGSLLLGANRDENPLRPSDDPRILVFEPRVVGGRDRVSGGTWLAVRVGSPRGADAPATPWFVAALLNRRPLPRDMRDPSTLRSRGLLCLDVAGANTATYSFLDAALLLVRDAAYGHCTLVGAGVHGEAWALHAGGVDPVARPIARGWHVITHKELDDPSEPRTRWVLEALQKAAFAGGGSAATRAGAESPAHRDVDGAVELLAGILRTHGDGERPDVCLHRDVFPTVSSSILVLGVPGQERYLHASGPPCIAAYRDYTPLLKGESTPT